MENKLAYQNFINTLKKSFGAKYTEYFVKLITLMIYSRIFTPDDFGIVAILQVFIVFFMMLSEVGIGPAIINFTTLNRKQVNGLFSITLLLAFAFSVIFFIFLNALNYFYQRDDFDTFGIFICFTIFFSALSIVPVNLFYREKKFYHIMRATIASELMALFFIIYLELYSSLSLPGFWLLCVAPFVSSFVKFVILWGMQRNNLGYFISIGRDLSVFKSIFSFSMYQFSFNVLNYFSRNLDNILIGKYIGTQELGVYGKSYEIMRYPLQLLTFALSPAIQPSIASNYDNLGLVRDLHNKFALNLLLGGGFFGVLFFYFSNDIVNVILGSQWGQVAPLIEIFSFIIPIQVLLSSSGGFFQGMRKTKEMFKSGVFSSLTNVTAISVGIVSGDIYILASCLVGSFTINTLQCYYLLYRNVFKSRVTSFLVIVFMGLLPYMVTHIVSYLAFIKFNPSTNYHVLDLFIKLLIIVVPYLLVSVIVKRRCLKIC